MSRLNPGTMVAGIFAVLIALAGAYVVRSYMLQGGPQAPPQPVADTSMQIPVAGTELLAGRTLRLGDIVLQRMEREDVARKIREQELPGDFMLQTTQIIGRILRDPIKSGETFTPDMFYPEGTGPTVADKLKPGYRAVTIQVTDAGIVAGFASPNTFVDVLFRSTELENFPETTLTILEEVQVLAVGQASYPGTKAGPLGTRISDRVHATLAVTPTQASVLRVLEGRGELSLSLRSPDEKSVATLESEFDVAADALSRKQRELSLLQEMDKLAEANGTEFSDRDRIPDLTREVDELRGEVKRIDAQLQLARSAMADSKLTLADVLGIPEPPEPEPEITQNPPPQMELYLGGRRTAVTFDSQTGAPAVSRVASGPRSGGTGAATGTSTARGNVGDRRTDPRPGTEPPQPAARGNRQPAGPSTGRPASAQGRPQGSGRGQASRAGVTGAALTAPHGVTPDRVDSAVRLLQVFSRLDERLDAMEAGAAPAVEPPAQPAPDAVTRAELMGVFTNLEDRLDSIDTRAARSAALTESRLADAQEASREELFRLVGTLDERLKTIQTDQARRVAEATERAEESDARRLDDLARSFERRLDAMEEARQRKPEAPETPPAAPAGAGAEEADTDKGRAAAAAEAASPAAASSRTNRPELYYGVGRRDSVATKPNDSHNTTATSKPATGVPTTHPSAATARNAFVWSPDQPASGRSSAAGFEIYLGRERLSRSQSTEESPQRPGS